MRLYIYLIISFFLVSVGCVSEKTILMRYYTIEMPEYQIPVTSDSNSVINGTCEIDQIKIHPVYEKNQIVNRSSTNEINYYVYNQWAIRPSEAISEIIRKYLESSGIFESVSSRYSRLIPDYKFGTSLNRLELIENKRSFSTHLNLEFRIIDNSNDQVILNHKADTTSTLKQKDLNLFAREVSSIIYNELKVFTMMIKDNRSLFDREPK